MAFRICAIGAAVQGTVMKHSHDTSLFQGADQT